MKGSHATVVEIERRLPQSDEAERAVLGAILLDNSQLDIVLANLDGSDLSEIHRPIFRQMIALSQTRQPIDLVTLTEALQRSHELEQCGSAAYVSSLVDGVPRVSNVEHYSRIVREHAIRRNVIRVAEAIKQDAFDGLDDADALLDSVRERIEGVSKRTALSWQQSLHTVDQLPCGEVEELIERILPPGVTGIGAASGIGKTWFGLDMASSLVTGKPLFGEFKVAKVTPVFYLCPEMGAKAFRRRCERLGIGGELFRCQTVSDGKPIDLSSPVLYSAVREMKPVVFLDTSIRFRAPGFEENSAGEHAEQAQQLFRLIHIGAPAVVTLHHRSKQEARSSELTLENVLRGTGDVGAIADAVWGLTHDRRGDDRDYLKESERLVRLRVRCVKSRDFRPAEEFRVQLDPFLDELGGLRVLAEEHESFRAELQSKRDVEIEKITRAIQKDSNASKSELHRQTGIHRDRIAKVATAAGFRFEPMKGWVHA